MGAETHIRVLSEHVINKIAAGEVVERPASILKELVENALDAGASQIDVDVDAGGRKRVAVSDNGSGMGRDDALLALERHATSKIRDVDDIERIATLGFRGEALSATASVSRFRLVTCRQGEVVGTEILVSGGTIQEVRDAGRPVGTTIEVRDLFFNVPARRKFLRAQQTEQAHLRLGFIVQALSHPAVGMSLTVDRREVYRLAAGSKIEERVRDLFGVECIRHLRPVSFKRGDLALSGFVSAPSAHRPDRNEQYVFINGRAASAPVLHHAIREGYHTLLASDRYPSVFLFIELDPAQVDVNVHPAKKEVRFRDPAGVRDALIAAIQEALSIRPLAGVGQGIGRGLESAFAPPAIRPPQDFRPAADVQLKIENLPPTRSFLYPRMPIQQAAGGDSMVGPAATETKQGGPSELLPKPGAAGSESAASSEPTPKSPWAWCRVLGQIGSLYVVLETEDGMVLMDPHAAHERVLFDRFMAEVAQKSVQTQNLLIPETVSLPPRDSMRLRKNLALFRDMGFGISEFGGDSFVVDALPACFGGASCQALLTEVALNLERAGARGGRDRWQEEAIAQAACKAAMKARDKLTLEEIERLVVSLARTEMPYTCPHGRPTLIFTSFREMNRKFGRE